MIPRSRGFVPLLACALPAATLAACDEGPTGIEPAAGDVLLDTTGSLAAVAGAEDTIVVVVPDGRVMGTIVESSEPIHLRYGPGEFDVIHSGFVGAFAAIVPQVGTGSVQLRVQRSMPAIAQADYRVRIVAVDDAPEHRDAHIRTGSRFSRDAIDPPLDRDVFEVELEEGVEFYVEMDPADDDVRITVVVMPPISIGFYLFLDAGPGLTRSEPHRTRESGRHRIVVYSAGLQPDVETGYRFRVVVTGE